MLSDYTTRVFQLFRNCPTWLFGSKCCEIDPVATPSPPLRDPALQQTHSCPTQAVLRVPVAASMPQLPSSMRAAALVTVKGAFTPNHVFPRACVAATGRATSIGLSVLIGIEREAAIELAGGKLTTGVAVHASVHSNRALGPDNPLATTEPAEPARTRLCEDTVRKPATLMEASPLFGPHKCPSVSP